MDLGLTEMQEMLKNGARDFLENECPEQLVRDMEEDDAGYSTALWQKMAEQGWQGLLIPEEHGGAGFDFLDLCVLLEEFGRALVPGPFMSTVLGGAVPLIEIGSDDQKAEFLPKIASGDVIFTLALTEPSARFDEEGVQCEASVNESFTFFLNISLVNHHHFFFCRVFYKTMWVYNLVAGRMWDEGTTSFWRILFLGHQLMPNN